MWLTRAMMEHLSRWIPEAAAWLQLRDSESGKYLDNVISRMRAAGEFKLALELDQAAQNTERF